MSTALLAPAAADTAYLDAHRAGDGVWIDMLYVPVAARGRGEGRRMVDAWIAALPREITIVQLFAADTGAGPSDGFWQRLGFEYRYTADEPDALTYEMRQRMCRGVNGHPTPAPILVAPDDEE